MRYTLSMDTLNNIPVLIPSLEIQEHIGGIFSDIDCKICLNRAINHNLPSLDHSSEVAEVHRAA